LILKDDVYIRLYYLSIKRGTSIGKIINQILEGYVENELKEDQNGNSGENKG